MKNFWDNLKVLINLFHSFGWAVRDCHTNSPCTYYFGPFLSVKEANAAKAGYIEDLEQEGARITVNIKRCKLI